MRSPLLLPVPLLLTWSLIATACSTADGGEGEGGGNQAADTTGSVGDTTSGTPGDPSTGTIDGSCPAAPYATPGPFVAGVTTLDMNGVAVEVWYPADQGAQAGLAADEYDMRWWMPADLVTDIPQDADTRFQTGAFRDLPASAAGPFPVVLFSHGLGGYRMQSTFLTQHLATWGFVVAAPEHAERGLAAVLSQKAPQDLTVTQLRDTLKRLESENLAQGVLAGRMDFNRVGVTGHSMGGAGSSVVAGDAGISAWAVLASAGFGAGVDKPALMMGGTHDQIATTKLVSDNFAAVDAEARRYVSIARAGHLGFTDICAVGRSQGGVLQIAMDAGLEIPPLLAELATDGCGAADLPAEEGWPIVNHFVTAHFKAALGSGVGPGLDDAARACFGDRIADWQTHAAATPVEPGPIGGDDTVGGDDSDTTEPDPTEPDTTEPDPAEPDTTEPDTIEPDTTEPEPTDPKAGVVTCGTSSCDLSAAVCCVGLTGAKCAATCGVFEAPQKCDGPEDCTGGQGCYAGFPSGAQCKATGAANDAELCHSDDDCSGGDTCNACSFPGSPPTNVCNTGC